MRRLAILFIAVGSVLGFIDVAHASSGTEPPTQEAVTTSAAVTATDLAPVDVLQVSGLIDNIIVDAINNAIADAETNGAQARFADQLEGFLSRSRHDARFVQSHCQRDCASCDLGRTFGFEGNWTWRTTFVGRRCNRHGPRDSYW